MNRTDRLLGILLELQARGQLTSRQLAERFEVARRTILRDLDALGQMGVPLVALPGRGGGCRLLEGYFLPTRAFTPGEAAALLVAADLLMSHGRSPYQIDLVQAADKVRALLGAARTSSPGPAMTMSARPDPGPALDEVNRAVEERETLAIEYESPGSGRTAREVDPHELHSRDGFWYFEAHCHLRGAERVFRVDRVVSLRRTGRRFSPPSSPEAGMRERDVPVRVALSRAAAMRLRDSSYLAPHVGPGLLALELPAPELPWLARAIVSLGDEAEVLEPAALRWLVAELALAALGQCLGDASVRARLSEMVG
ncbi:MAG: YafY family protein [bacterium]|nr:YafY family protein [bacterium]